MNERENYNNLENTLPDKNSKTPWKIIDVVYIYAVIFSISIIITGIFLLSNFDAKPYYLPAAVQVTISSIALFVIYFVITKKYNISFKDSMGLSQKKFVDHFFLGIFISFILVISTTIVTFTFTEIGGIPRDNPYINISVEKLRMIALMAVFVAPVFEEIFFRGFMQPALINKIGAFGGILITALIFGFSHSQYLDHSAALIAVTTIGLILGITREKTGSITPCIIAHLFNNLFASMSLY